MTELEKRIDQVLHEVASYWLLYLTPGNARFQVKHVQPLVGPLYRVTVEMDLWESFTFDALYVDSDPQALFIDAYMLSHFTEFLIKQRAGA